MKLVYFAYFPIVSANLYSANAAYFATVYGVPALAGWVLSLEGGSKHLEIHGKTASDRLKPGLHTLWLRTQRPPGCKKASLNGELA